MPIYEYDCSACGQRFEKISPIELRHEPVRCTDVEDCPGAKLRMPTRIGFPHPDKVWNVVGDEPPDNVDDYEWTGRYATGGVIRNDKGEVQ